MEYTIISNRFENGKLKEKTIFYYEEEEHLKIAFNHFIKALTNNNYEIDIFNKKNHITATNKDTKLEISTYYTNEQ